MQSLAHWQRDVRELVAEPVRRAAARGDGEWARALEGVCGAVIVRHRAAARVLLAGGRLLAARDRAHLF